MFYTQQSFQEELLKGIKIMRAKYGIDFVCKWMDDIHFCYIPKTFIGAQVLKKSFNVYHCVCAREEFWDNFYSDYNEKFIKVFLFNISDESFLYDDDLIQKNYLTTCKFEGTGWLCKYDSVIDYIEHFELLLKYHTCSNQPITEWTYHYKLQENERIPKIFDYKYDIEILRYIYANRNEIRKLYQIFK